MFMEYLLRALETATAQLESFDALLFLCVLCRNNLVEALHDCQS